MVKKKDLLLLAYLRENARRHLKEISKKTGVPVSTLHDRIRANAGDCILRNCCLLDFDALGFNVKAHVLFKIKKEDKEKISKYLQKSWHVNNLYKINNGFDFIAEFVFKSINEMENFFEDLESKFKIKSKDVHYIIEDVQREAFLAKPDIVPMMFPDLQ